MPSKTAAWTLAALLSGSGAAFAAPATSDEAQLIRGQLERYLGRGPVAVTPEGDAYRIAIDLKAALKGLERFGVTLDPVTYRLSAAAQGDGTWHVTSGSPPLITVKAGGQTTSIAANNQSFDGIFDPRIPAFTKSTSSYDSLSIGTVGTGQGKAATVTAVQTRQLQHGQQTMAATPAGDGVIDAKFTQGNTAYAQDFVLDAAKGAQHVTVTGGPTSDTFTISKLPIRALLDLWAFLVAHPSPDELKTNQAAFKDLLRRALPLFASLTQDGTLGQLAVATPFGPVAAHALSTHLDLTGLTDNGSASFAVKADDLVLPVALLPPWAPALIPTGIDLHDSLTGYRLDQAAEAAIDGLDLGAPEPLSPATSEKIQAALGSRDTLVVKLGDNRITTPTFEAQFSGEVHLVQPTPTFTVAVHARGLDKAIAAVRTKAAKDPTAAQAIAILTLVKGYGKADGNDAFSWDVAGDGTGALTVNGVPLPIGPSK